jgi:hypothetical protein
VTDLPPECVALLEDALDTIEKLDAALRLSRSEAVEPALVAELAAAGIVDVGPPVRLVPRDDVARLIAMYGEERGPVISALSTIAVQRIRVMAARTFGPRSKPRR